MLLAGSQGKVEAAPTLLVESSADEAPGEAPHQLFATGDEADVRPAIAGAQTKLLALAHRDVGTVFAGRGEDGQADRVNAGDG